MPFQSFFLNDFCLNLHSQIIVQRGFWYALYASLRTAKRVNNISLALRRQRILQLKHFPNYDGYGHICQWKSKLTHHICSLFVFRSHLLTLPTKTSCYAFFPLQLAWQRWYRWGLFSSLIISNIFT